MRSHAHEIYSLGYGSHVLKLLMYHNNLTYKTIKIW